MSKSEATVRDQLGNDPVVFPTLNADYDESVGLEEGPLIIQTNTLGNAWIVGTSTNAIVGTNTATIGGGQQVVGGSGTTRVLLLKSVTNTNNIFIDHFRFDIFDDSGTAVFDTTNYRVSMDSSTSHGMVKNTYQIIGPFYKDVANVFNVNVSCDETKYGNDVISYQVSADGKSNWQAISLNTTDTISNIGNECYLRVHFIGNGNADTYIENLRISYNG